MKAQTFFLLFLLNITTYSQQVDPPNGSGYTSIVEYMSNFIPAQVSHTEFNSYGNTEINYAMGRPNINIPLYTIEEDGVVIPISINYDASGIKANDKSNIVGLKWSLNAGGNISRNIIGLEDETPNLGWFQTINQYNIDTIQSTYNYNTLSPNVNEHANSNEVAVIREINSGERDFQSDEYSINFPNVNDEFSFDKNGYLVQRNSASINKISFDVGNKMFTVKDPKGYTYIFGDENSNNFYERSNNGSTLINTSTIVSAESSNFTGGISSFLINKVKSPFNEELIKFEYETDSINTFTSESFESYNFSYPTNTENQQNQCPVGSTMQRKIVSSSYFKRPVKKIISRDVNIYFNYSAITNSDIDKVLSSIWVESKSEQKYIKKIFFVYSNYQGSNKVKLDAVEFFSGTNNFLNRYVFNYHNGTIPNMDSKSRDINGYYNGKINDYQVDKDFFDFSSNNMPPQSVLSDVRINANRKIDTNFIFNGILTDITYPTGGKTYFEYYVPEYLRGNLNITAGVFIKKIYDETRGEKYNIREFDFETSTGNSEIKSSFKNNSLTNYCQNSYFFSDNFPQSNMRRRFNQITVKTLDQQNNVLYHQKYTYRWIMDNPFLLKKEVHTSDSDITVTDIYNYNPIASIKGLTAGGESEVYVPGQGEYAIGTTYYSLSTNMSFYTSYMYLKSSTEKKEIKGTLEMLEDEYYEYNNYDQLSKITRTNANGKGDNLLTTFKYPYDYGGDALMMELVNQNRVKEPIETAYFHNSEINLLGKKRWNYANNISENNLILKSSLATQKSNQSPLDERIDFKLYNSYGKPIEIALHGGINVSYFWSHNNKYLIARVENASYQEIAQALNISIDSLKSYDETNLSELDSLRLYPSLGNAHVITYKYKEAIGLINMTGPRGKTTQFKYDDFGRLEQLRDFDNHILKDYKYGYKQGQ
ncbi:hypothetical protein MACH07_22030 [Flagellimonas marinaquae]|uniref:YD repeat-containing protein n=1 Tax=Flagellimonas marinaquae TaxID=254955 RepID=A0AA48HS34_9FLAO|nr:hypothetical protein MACH07_22030 [Allomuricauda aquimarina]